MPQVKIATSVAPTSFPAGTLLGQYRFRLFYGTVAHTTLTVDAPLPPEVIFDNVSPATYTLRIDRLTADGSATVGTTYMHPTPIVVAAPPPVTADAVVGATVVVV